MKKNDKKFNQSRMFPLYRIGEHILLYSERYIELDIDFGKACKILDRKTVNGDYYYLIKGNKCGWWIPDHYIKCLDLGAGIDINYPKKTPLELAKETVFDKKINDIV